MDLAEILRVLRSRWYIVLPMMLLTGGLAVLANIYVPTKYESQSTISLLSAERATTNVTKGNANPFLTFDSSLVATADFLSRSLTSNESKAELAALGVKDEYTAGLADNAQGPFITLTVTGTNPKQVLASTELLADFAGRKLKEIQAGSGVKDEDMVRLIEITPAQTPEAQMKDKLEIVIGAAGAGTVLAFALTFIVEGLARSRRRWPAGMPQPVPAAITASAAPPRKAGEAEQSQTTMIIPVHDQTITLPRIPPPVEFHEPTAVAVTRTVGEGKTKSKAKQADPVSGPSTEDTMPTIPEPLARGHNGSTKTSASGKGSLWSTVYRSNGKTGPRDADAATGD